MVSSSFYIQNVQRKCTSFDMPTLFTPFYMFLFIHSPSLPFLGVVHRGGLKTTFPPRGSEDFSAAGGSGSVLGPSEGMAWHRSQTLGKVFWQPPNIGKTLESIVNPILKEVVNSSVYLFFRRVTINDST